MRKIYFHIHIWKTGGTSFFTICRENFGNGFRRDTMLIQEWFLSNEQLRWLIGFHDWIRCYSCHMLSGDLPYEVKDAKVIGIAFIRNPVNRFVSSYNFANADTYRGGFAKNTDFEDFLIKALVEAANPLWRNGQTFVLAGSGTEDGLSIISERIKNRQLLLLPTERFDESCIILERLFPEDFKDCSYTKHNVSRQRKTATEAQRTTIAKYMDIDFKLHKLANEHLDSTLDRLFPDLNERKQYMDDFGNRCKLKKRRQRTANIIGNIDRSVRTTLKKIMHLT